MNSAMAGLSAATSSAGVLGESEQQAAFSCYDTAVQLACCCNQAKTFWVDATHLHSRTVANTVGVTPNHQQQKTAK